MPVVYTKNPRRRSLFLVQTGQRSSTGFFATSIITLEGVLSGFLGKNPDPTQGMSTRQTASVANYRSVIYSQNEQDFAIAASKPKPRSKRVISRCTGMITKKLNLDLTTFAERISPAILHTIQTG